MLYLCRCTLLDGTLLCFLVFSIEPLEGESAVVRVNEDENDRSFGTQIVSLAEVEVSLLRHIYPEVASIWAHARPQVNNTFWAVGVQLCVFCVEKGCT
jgi:hypothetical protein